MDLRAYYQKIRQIESTFTEDDVVVVSLETSDGGKAGVSRQVPKAIAAQLIVEGRFRPASTAEEAAYLDQLLEAGARAELTAAARKTRK